MSPFFFGGFFTFGATFQSVFHSHGACGCHRMLPFVGERRGWDIACLTCGRTGQLVYLCESSRILNAWPRLTYFSLSVINSPYLILGFFGLGWSENTCSNVLEGMMQQAKALVI